MRLNIITPPDTPEVELLEVFDDSLTPLGTTQAKIDHPGALTSLISAFPRKGSGLFPPGLKYISPDQTLIIFERPPQYVDVTYANADLNAIEAGGGAATVTRQTFKIPLPWLVYVGVLSPTNDPLAIWVYATNGPLTSMEMQLGLFSLPNFYNDSRLCMAPQTNFGAHNTIAGAVDAIYNAVWATHFNNDLFAVFTDRFTSIMTFMKNPTLKDFINKKSTEMRDSAGQKIPLKMAGAAPYFEWWSRLTLIDMLNINVMPMITCATIINRHAAGELTAGILDDVNMDAFLVQRILSSVQNNCSIVV